MGHGGAYARGRARLLGESLERLTSCARVRASRAPLPLGLWRLWSVVRGEGEECVENASDETLRGLRLRCADQRRDRRWTDAVSAILPSMHCVSGVGIYSALRCEAMGGAPLGSAADDAMPWPGADRRCAYGIL